MLEAELEAAGAVLEVTGAVLEATGAVLDAAGAALEAGELEAAGALEAGAELDEDETSLLDEDAAEEDSGSEEDEILDDGADVLEEGPSTSAGCFNSDTPMLTATTNISRASATITIADTGDFLAFRFTAIDLLHLIKNFLECLRQAVNINEYITI